MVENQKHNPLGRHLLIEFWGCKAPESMKKWEEILWQAAKAAKSAPLKISMQKFEPQGITGVVILEESHIAIHTWPEKEYVAIDIFTCGEHTDPQAGMEYLAKELSPKKIDSQFVVRGKEKND